jgi:hypothetical protein
MEQFTENKNNFYEKKPDLVDLYLMRIIERFFSTEKINSLAARNAIIAEAMARYKETLNYKDKGVRSFNGKEGIVWFTLYSLQIESMFIKRTAFNKDFGKTAGTICAGNDSRLKNKRKPLPHSHKLKDVPDFAEQIKSMHQEVARYGHHLHLNKDVIDNMTYSGNEIDLIRVEQLQSEIIVKLNTLNQKIAELKELETAYKIILDRNFAIIESGGSQ